MSLINILTTLFSHLTYIFSDTIAVETGATSSGGGSSGSTLLGSRDATATAVSTEPIGIIVFDTSMIMTTNQTGGSSGSIKHAAGTSNPPTSHLPNNNPLSSHAVYSSTACAPGTYVLAPQAQRRGPHLLDERGDSPHPIQLCILPLMTHPVMYRPTQ